MPSRLSLVAAGCLAVAVVGGCGRDALVDVPSDPGGTQVDAGGLVPSVPSTPRGTGGAGGSAGTGGVPGGPALDAARPVPLDAGPANPRLPDAAVPACANLPSCLATLAATCPATGACTMQRQMGNTNQCYMNGVKVIASGGGQASARVTQTDGRTLCYTVAGNLRGGGGGAGASLTYSDSSARVLATGTFQGGGGGGQIVVSCAGAMAVPVSVPLACAPGATALLGLVGVGGGGMMCTNGTCTP
jgi:hypothetical protein